MYRILTNISILSVFIPFVCGVIKFKNLSLWLRLLFIYIIGSALVEILSLIFRNSSLRGYFATQNTFVVFESIVLLLIYCLGFFSQAPIKSIKIALTIGLISIGSLILTDEYFKPNNILTTIESLLIIALSIYYFIRIQFDSISQNPIYTSFFWFNISVSIYFTTSLVLFLFIDFIQHSDQKTVHVLWGLHLACNIIYNNLLAISLWKAR